MDTNASGHGDILIKLLGFSDSEKEVVSCIFDLAEGRLTSSWAITDYDDNADFYLLSNLLRTQVEQDPSLQKIPNNKCIVCTNELDTSQYYQLLVDSHNIPYLRHLIELLNNISTQLSSASVIAESEDAAPLSDAVAALTDTFNPEKHPFIRYLIVNDRQDILHISLNNCEPLYIDFGHNSYYTSSALELLEPYFNANATYQVQTIEAEQLQEIVHQQALKSQPLNNLIWYSTFKCSQGKVLHSYQKGDVVRLKRWPDINISCCKELIRLAAYLQSNATDLQTAQLKTEIPLDQVYSFYNACAAIDLIEQRSANDFHEKKLETTQRDLYQKIGQLLSNFNLK